MNNNALKSYHVKTLPFYPALLRCHHQVAGFVDHILSLTNNSVCYSLLEIFITIHITPL
ncbi:hypothetical protein Hdeb2414_s0003g00102761 [Helianthus debilis subsp. tardiflorus]